MLMLYGLRKKEWENGRLGFRFDFLRYINFIIYSLKESF